MGKGFSFLVGAVIGSLAGWALTYLFAPAEDADLATGYRSRWDRALEEGRQAARQREAELRREFQQAKRADAGTDLSTSV